MKNFLKFLLFLLFVICVPQISLASGPAYQPGPTAFFPYGNWTQIYGIYQQVPFSLTDGQLAGLQLDANGKLLVDCSTCTGGSGGTSAPFSGLSDAQSPATNQGIGFFAYNGATWDRIHSISINGQTGYVTAASALYDPISGKTATVETNGSLKVDNSGNTQPISGSVSVSNFPTSFIVSNFPATQPISGSVSISNFPATQPVSGSVAVSNFPATQPVSGSVTALTGINSSGTGQPIIACDASTFISVGSATTAQVIGPAASGKHIHICGFDFISNGAGTVKFESGTQTTTPCDTIPAAVSGAYPVTAQTGISRGTGLGQIILLPSATALCIVTADSGTGGASAYGTITYTVF